MMKIFDFVQHYSTTTIVGSSILAFYVLLAIAAVISRYVSSRGQIIKKRVPTLRTDELAPTGAPKRKLVLDLAAVSGDAVEVIADEMYPRDGLPHSYIKHGVVVPSKLCRTDRKQPALVIDVGANVGLFGVSMKYMCDVDVASRPKNDNGSAAATTAAASGKGRQQTRAGSARGARGAATPSAAKRGGGGRATQAAVTAANDDDDYAPPSVRVVGFEPIPETFECARRNFDTYFGETNERAVLAGHPEHVSCVRQIGIGQKRETLTFHYDPAFSAMASMAKAEISAIAKTAPLLLIGSIMQDARDFKKNRLEGRSLVNDFIFVPLYNIMGAYGTLMRTPGINIIAAVFLLPFFLAFIIWRVCSMPHEKTTECLIEPLPQALKRVNADDPSVSIALLKVDVEGAEEQVLLGVDDVTWSRVHQCVVEIHQTPDDRVGRLVKLLKEKGFKKVYVDVEEFATHQVCEVKTVFATR